MPVFISRMNYLHLRRVDYFLDFNFSFPSHHVKNYMLNWPFPGLSKCPDVLPWDAETWTKCPDWLGVALGNVYVTSLLPHRGQAHSLHGGVYSNPKLSFGAWFSNMTQHENPQGAC